VADTAVIAWRQYRLERRMFWRNPSAAFFNFALPLIFLFLIAGVFGLNKSDREILIPGIAGMSVMTTTFTALAFNVTFLREQGILKRIRGTPLPPVSYFGGLIANAVANTAVQVTLVTLAGRVFFGTGWPIHWLELVVFVAVGVACFASLGVALSHVIPNLDSAPAYTNAIFLPLVVLSGVFYDADNAPAFLHDIAAALPLTHLIDGLSGAMVTGKPLADNLSHLAVIALWGAAGTVLAIRGFSWDARRD
jgi:ABC-2 type transport system permease protein